MEFYKNKAFKINLKQTAGKTTVEKAKKIIKIIIVKIIIYNQKIIYKKITKFKETHYRQQKTCEIVRESTIIKTQMLLNYKSQINSTAQSVQQNHH